MPPRSKEESFKKGDKVQAKWSGSSIYYPATVKEIEGKQCKVQYEDGSVHSIKLSDVKASASKADSASRAKTNRIRSRSRSGGRKPRSRSRTPPRKTRTTTKSEKSVEKKVNSVSAERYSTEVDSPKKEVKRPSPKKTPSPKLATRNSSRTSTVIYSEAIQTSSILNTTSSAQPRTSARIAALQTTRLATRTPELSSEKKFLTRVGRSRAKYSDDEESEEEEDEIDVVAVERGFSYLSCIGAALKIIFLVTIPVVFTLVCSKRQCNLLDIKNLYTYIQDLWQHGLMIPLSACLSFHLTLSIMSKIPIGREINGFPFGVKGMVRKYRLSGIYMLIFSVMTFCGLAYYKIDMNWGYETIRPIVASSLIYALLWSFVLHLKALIRGVNADQAKSNKSSGFLGNFYYGHEINPVLYFDEDVKTRFIQFGLIGLALLDVSILTRFVLMKGSFKVILDEIITRGSPLFLSLGFQLFTIVDYFWREETMLSTALYMNDGVGFGFLAGIGCLIPSMFAVQGVFISYQAKAIHLPHWCSAMIFILFCFGYYLYASSSNLKYNFRRNAYSASVSNIASIPTSKKKRLIVSGLWGIVRHPNYLGFIIMVIASSLPCGFSHIMPYTPVFVVITMLILRSFDVETICQEKYGPAWGNYVEKVRSRFIPRVF